MTTKMTPERFQARWNNYKKEPQQASGVWLLYEAINSSNKADEILDEDADWAKKFSEPPKGPASALVIPGMIGPSVHPNSFGFKSNDHHLLMNDKSETLDCYDFAGKRLWSIDAIARGQYKDTDYKIPRSDTPPGLYKIGQIYNDYAAVGNSPSYNSTLQSYGWISFDMISLDGNEEKAGRAGIMLHGGGSALGWPGAWAPNQALVPTLGCIRIHNVDLKDKILPLTQAGTVYISVYQEL